MKQLRDYDLFNFTDEERAWLDNHSIFIGDIHNHSSISYGHGSLDKAISFASQQLDFFSVTGHFAWPDMECTEGMDIPESVVAYHKDGFAKLRRNWSDYIKKMTEAESASFIPFPSYEFHSFYYGDYTVVSKDLDAVLPDDPEEGIPDKRLDMLIRDNNPYQSGLLAFPHHIGYKQGYRGINWSEFNGDSSRVVEIASMHGCSESHESKLQYLHTMGPRSRENTMQGGLKRGLKFGVIANTDHHNSSPGSYGFGRTGVYSSALNRDEIWNSILDRRTIAFTGDPMRIALFANGKIIGESASAGSVIKGAVVGFDEIESLELVYDGNVVARGTVPDVCSSSGFISIDFGWGERNSPCMWTVDVSLEGASIEDGIPRYRGLDVVDPLERPDQSLDDSTFFSLTEGRVKARFLTDGNRTASTNGTQGFVIEVNNAKGILKVNAKAAWKGEIIERHYAYNLEELDAPMTEYIKGFVSPAVRVGAFVPLIKACAELDYKADKQGAYYLRAYEKNGDGVYTTPIWID